MLECSIFTHKLGSSAFTVHVQALFSVSFLSFVLFCFVFFIVPASVTIENGTLVVLEGRNVTLHCFPFGFPLPNISWIDFSNHTVQEGSILKFLNISRRKNGSYTCSAANACGSDWKKVDIIVECESMSTLKLLMYKPQVVNHKFWFSIIITACIWWIVILFFLYV